MTFVMVVAVNAFCFSFALLIAAMEIAGAIAAGAVFLLLANAAILGAGKIVTYAEAREAASKDAIRAWDREYAGRSE